MERYRSGQSDIFKLEIDSDAKNNFLDMARWTKFLAILGFVVQGLILVLGIFASLFINRFYEAYGGASPFANLGAAGPVAVMAIFLLIITVYIYPTYMLMKYSTTIKAALLNDNKEQFNTAIRCLKNVFRYIGVLVLVVLAIYGIQIMLVVFGALNR